MFVEYPKQLYRASYEDTAVVNDADQEAGARADGFEMFSEIYEREGQFPAPAKAKRGRKASATDAGAEDATAAVDAVEVAQ